VLGVHRVQYWSCGSCGLLQTEAPWWLEEAYGEPIAALDTGVLSRAVDVGRVIDALLTRVLRPSGAILDFAGGYGLLVRYLRDRGWNCRWHDPYAPNLLARGFEWDEGEPCEVVLATEVIEHLADPLGALQDLRRRTSCGAMVLTTVLLPEPVPAPGEWWYYSLDTGQHISFLQERTLRYIAADLQMTLHSSGNVHLLADHSIPPIARLCTSRLAPLLAAGRQRPSLTQPDHDELRTRLQR
jgi:hypothetical protein